MSKFSKLEKIVLSIIIILIIILIVSITGIIIMNNKTQNTDIIEKENISNVETESKGLLDLAGNDEDCDYYMYACYAKMYEEIPKQYPTEKISNETKMLKLMAEDEQNSSRFLLSACVVNDNCNNINLDAYRLYLANPSKYYKMSTFGDLVVLHSCMAIIDVDCNKLKELYDNDKIHNDNRVDNEKEIYASAVKNIIFINLEDIDLKSLAHKEYGGKKQVDLMNSELKKYNWKGEYFNPDNVSEYENDINFESNTDIYEENEETYNSSNNSSSINTNNNASTKNSNNENSKKYSSTTDVLNNSENFTKYNLKIVNNAKTIKAKADSIYEDMNIKPSYTISINNFFYNGEIISTGTDYYNDIDSLLSKQLVFISDYSTEDNRLTQKGTLYVRKGVDISNVSVNINIEYEAKQKNSNFYDDFGYVFKPNFQINGDVITLVLDTNCIVDQFYG